MLGRRVIKYVIPGQNIGIGNAQVVILKGPSTNPPKHLNMEESETARGTLVNSPIATLILVVVS